MPPWVLSSGKRLTPLPRGILSPCPPRWRLPPTSQSGIHLSPHQRQVLCSREKKAQDAQARLGCGPSFMPCRGRREGSCHRCRRLPHRRGTAFHSPRLRPGGCRHLQLHKKKGTRCLVPPWVRSCGKRLTPLPRGILSPCPLRWRRPPTSQSGIHLSPRQQAPSQ